MYDFFFLLVRFFFLFSSNRSKTLYINGKSHNIPIQYHPSEGQEEYIKWFKRAAAAPLCTWTYLNLLTHWIKSYSHLNCLTPPQPSLPHLPELTHDLWHEAVTIENFAKSSQRRNFLDCRQFEKVKAFMRGSGLEWGPKWQNYKVCLSGLKSEPVCLLSL